ncbi:uncharacterized protein LOC119553678 isoform X2 [Drosophila subpulchrella]|nr:uncharacterized protein LOC119553678 isoform X2 [Drosophila subpulchrella]XP_037720152.1 uncharacterized protein LOC119553678 isoform X2 [Drosophila subpulchrella]
MSAVNSNSSACSTMKLYPKMVSQSFRRPSDLNKKNKKGPKLIPELETDQRALVKAKPKRKKVIVKKSIARSTAGNVEQCPDDDGIWFECNVPFRVNIPFPISMKNLFGPQSYSGNRNFQIFKALVPTRKFQKDRKTECPFQFTMCPALPSPDPESDTSCSKAIKFSKKKCCRRGRKHCPCEISTQTIGEESDPVLCCLEQIRNQLADKSAENQEKSIYRCFAEKSTSVKSIEKHTNKTDMEKINNSASIGTPQEQIDKNENLQMSKPESIQKISPTTSLNILAQPKPEVAKKDIHKNLPTTQTKSDSAPSTASLKSPKKSHKKKKTISNLSREVTDSEEPRIAEKEKDLNYAHEPVSKSAICVCRLSHVLHKCTRIVIPCSVCQCHCLNRSHKSRQNPRKPQQQQQGNESHIHPTTTFKEDDVDIKSKPINTIQGNELPENNNQDINPSSSHPQHPILHVGTDGKMTSLKRVPEQPKQILQDNKLKENSLPKEEYPQYHVHDRPLSSEKSKPQPKTQPNNPSDGENYPESLTNLQVSENSSQKGLSNISSNESISSSKESHRTPKIINSNAHEYSSKSDKSLEGAKSKKQISHRKPSRNKKNKQRSNRMSSGGETVPEDSTYFTQTCKNDTICKIEVDYDNCDKCGSNISTNSEQLSSEAGTSRQEREHTHEEQRVDNPYRRNKTNFADMSKNSKKLETEQEKLTESFSVDQGMNDIKEGWSNITRNSDEISTLGNYSNNREYRSYCEMHEYSEGIVPETSESEFKHQLNHIPYQCRNENSELYYKQRSQSAPECWILQCSHRNQTPQYATFISRKENCKEYTTYPENVLVLQDETCESESNECVLVMDDKETLNTGCCPCKTPDYSINADILKQLREQERLLNQVQDITIIPRNNQCPIDFEISPQEQERDNTPLVPVPYRINERELFNLSRPNEWRDQGGNFTKPKPKQFQVAPKTSRVPPQNLVYGKKIKTPRERNSNTSFSRSEDNYPTTSSSVKTKYSRQKPTSTGTHRNNNIQNIKQLSYPESRMCQRKTFWDSSASSSRHSPPSQSNASVESRGRPKTPGNPSYTRLTGLKNDSNDSPCHSKSIRCALNSRHLEDSQQLLFEHKNKQLRKNQSYSPNGYRSDRNNQDSLQSLRSTGVAQSSTPGLTWTEPDRTPNVVIPLDAPSVNKSIDRSNGTVRSTDVETLQTVTLMQPRKLRESQSARIRSQVTGFENTVLIETRTPCNRENLLQACGRPPCNFRPQQYTGVPPNLHQGFIVSKPTEHSIQPQTSMSAPQYRTTFDENYLIDPRDQWSIIKSPASAPVMNSPFQQHHHPRNPYQPTNSIYHHFQEPVHNPAVSSNGLQNSGYYSQTLKENIRILPEGFYDQTVNKYNITRMDSNFQPPPLIPEFLQAQQQPFFRHTACPYSNQFQQQLVMGSAPDINRPFIPAQNQYPSELQSHPSLFRPHQSVKLDDYDQSEYQI